MGTDRNNAPRIQASTGFTLVELVLVVTVLAILVAIAVPLFLNQSKIAQDSAAKADLQGARTALVSWAATEPSATAVPSPPKDKLRDFGWPNSDKLRNDAASFTARAATFCIEVSSDSGKIFKIEPDGDVQESACP